MNPRFHLAITVESIEESKAFYCDLLGCELGNYENDWIDINFWGHELTLHKATEEEQMLTKRHHVDMADVCVPHFGVHLEAKDFAEVKKRIEASEIDYFDNPYRRFVGSKFEQETFFVEDPNGNVLEIKTMSNPEILFEVAS